MERQRSEKMKEIREAAVAYCKNMPEDVHEQALAKFQSMDTNNDKKITYVEFSKAYKQLEACGDQKSVQKLFDELDENGDKFLDFEEFLTLFYILTSGRLKYCDGCQQYLKGLYFTCLPCFDKGDSFANYCTTCYRDGHHRKHEHDHEVTFVDNYALLLSRAGSTYGAAVATLSKSFQPGDPNNAQMQSESFLPGEPSNAQSEPFQLGEPNKAQMRKSRLGNFLQAMGIKYAGHAIKQAFRENFSFV